MEDHKIIFTGQLVTGFLADTVKNDFSNLFKLTDSEKLNKIFSGNSVVIKSGLNAEKAKKFLQRLQSIGLVVEIQPPLDAIELNSEFSLQEFPDDNNQPTSVSSETHINQVKFDIPAANTSAGIKDESIAQTSPVEDKASDTFAGLSLEPIEQKVEEKEAVEEINENGGTSNREVSSSRKVASRVGQTHGSAAASAVVGLGMVNSSGSGKGAVLPDEAKGLCWGAFFLNIFWGLRNKVYISFLALIPYVNFIVMFYLLFKGRELSWQNQKWESVEEFNKSQKIWGWVGFIFGLVPFILLTMAVTQMNKNLDDLENMTPEERAAYELQQDEEMQKAFEDIDDPELKKQMEELRLQMKEFKKNK